MIIRDAGDRQLLITQPDHAALAARIMAQWAVDLPRAPRRASILLAVAEHDHGWHEPDAAPIVDEATGRLLDFVHAPVAVRTGVWPRAIAHLAPRDPWAAALVAHHALTVYVRFRQDGAWGAFFDEMADVRDRHVRTAGGTLADLEADYLFVRLGDLASLTFCTGWTDEQRHQGWAFRLEGDRLHVSPDPFAGRVVPLAVPARALADRSFRSPADARAAWDAAPTVEVRGAAAGA